MFSCLKVKPLPRASVNFLFNSYKPMLLSEIVYLTVPLMLIFVKLRSYTHT